jgi:hypothetical protein
MKIVYILSLLIGISNSQEVIHIDSIQPQRLAGDPYLGGAKEDFIDRQKELITDKQLSLWGVGLFSGTDVFSTAIKAVTMSKTSHVGMILVDQNGTKYSYESTGSAGDVLQGITPQVQIHLWDDVVHNYGGRIDQRQFIFTEPERNDSSVISPYVYGRIGMPYEKDIVNLVSSIIRGNSKGTPNSVFCSEETARLLMHLKYLSPDRVADNYLPRDFTSKEYIPLQGCSLGEQTRVKKGKRKWCILF